MSNTWTTLTLLAALLAAPGCAMKTASGPGAFHASSLVPFAPKDPPGFSGTYDFDMLGPSQGTACAEWGQALAGGFREVLVNGRPDYYSVAISGAALENDDPRIQQAQSAAAYTALSQLPGADLLLVTRTVVRSESPTRVCAYVYGEMVRMKKGATVVEPHAAVAAPVPAPSPAGAPPPPPPPPPPSKS